MNVSISTLQKVYKECTSSLRKVFDICILCLHKVGEKFSYEHLKETKFQLIKQMIFAVFGLGVAVITYCFFETTGIIVALGMISSLLVWPLMKNATIPISSNLVCIGWISLIFATVIVCASVIPISEGTGQHFGVLLGFFVAVIIYRLIPLISYHLGLNDERTGCYYSNFEVKENCKTNGWMLISMMYLFCALIIVIYDAEVHKDKLFENEPYIEVLAIDKEMHSGETYYVIKCKKGRFTAKPYDYPKLRDLKVGDKVRVLLSPGNNGVYYVDRIDFEK